MPIPPRTPLSAAADRLDRFVREVKERQLEANGVKGMPLPNRPVADPDEAWMREHAIHAIRKRQLGEVTDLPPRVARMAWRPHPLGLPEKKTPIRPEPGAGLLREGHIGAGLGKPGPKHGILSRIFHRHDK